MGVLGIMRVGQYQAVKAFGDKPRLMTRKSVVALICTGPLANRRKAVNYTKETPNLLRNMLNIPSLLGGRGNQRQCYILLVFLSKPNLKASIPFYFCCGSWEKTPREFKGKDRGFWSVVLADRWKKISFGHSVRQFLLNWSLLLWDLGKSIHIIRLVDCIACFWRGNLILFWKWVPHPLQWHHHHCGWLISPSVAAGTAVLKQHLSYRLRLEGI